MSSRDKVGEQKKGELGLGGIKGGKQTNDLLPEPQCHCSCSANCYRDSVIWFGSEREAVREKQSKKEN